MVLPIEKNGAILLEKVEEDGTKHVTIDYKGFQNDFEGKSELSYDEIEAYKRGELFGISAPRRLPSLYDKIQDGPKSVDNFVPDIRSNPTALQRVANNMKCVFRWQGVTYKSTYNPNKK